jgi:hypothetical protein
MRDTGHSAQIFALVEDKLDITALALGGEVACNSLTLENMREVAGPMVPSLAR